jgi:hypothetical protein
VRSAFSFSGVSSFRTIARASRYARAAVTRKKRYSCIEIGGDVTDALGVRQ